MKATLIVGLLVIIGETVSLYCTRGNPVTRVLMELHFHIIYVVYALSTLQRRVSYFNDHKRGVIIVDYYQGKKWAGNNYKNERDALKPYFTYKELRASWRKVGRL